MLTPAERDPWAPRWSGGAWPVGSRVVRQSVARGLLGGQAEHGPWAPGWSVGALALPNTYFVPGRSTVSLDGLISDTVELAGFQNAIMCRLMKSQMLGDS